MEPITRLILNLNQVEITTFKEYLKVFSGKETKYLLLFESILKNPDLSKQELSTILYGNWNNKYWLNISKRLEQKITDFFIAELGMEVMSRDLGENPSRTFELRKKLLGASVLRRRGHYEIMEDIILSVIKEAEYLYLPGFIIEAGRELQAVWDNQKDKKEKFSMISEKIEWACTHFQAIQENENLYWRVKNILEGTIDQEKLAPILAQMKENASIYPRAAFYYHYIHCLIYTQYQPDTILANPHFEALENLFQSNEGLVWPHRMGTILFNRATLALHERNFDDSLLYYEKSLTFFPAERVNFYIVKRNIAWVHLLNNNLSEASKILKKITNKTNDFPVLTHPIYMTLFLLAFIEKEYSKALKYLKIASQANISSEDETLCKIYELVTIIEMENFDLFSTKMENFRKWMKKYNLSKLDEIIYQIFKRIESHSFDFNLLSFEEKLLQTLKNEPLKLRSELIRMDLWFESKINNTEYFPMFLNLVKNKEIKSQL